MVKSQLMRVKKPIVLVEVNDWSWPLLDWVIGSALVAGDFSGESSKWFGQFLVETNGEKG